MPRRRQLERGSKSIGSPMIWLDEKDVYGDIYNHPKLDEGYNDDNIYAEPYRHIRNWFLAKPGCVETSRVPFPKNATKFANASLYGELEPSIDSQDRPNAKVVITDIQYWMIDRHREDRGIWVLSNLAWYRLKQPCRKFIKQPNGKRISQHELHQSWHAKVSLLSNIVDMMSDSRGYIQPTLVAFHANLSPEESYNSLLLSEEDIISDASLMKEPFDLRLLKHDAHFIMSNLLNLDTVLSKTCEFIKGLKKLQKEKNKNKRKIEDNLDYASSVKASEERCNRWPWGEQKMNSNGEWNNSMVALSNLKLNLLLKSKNINLTDTVNDSSLQKEELTIESDEGKVHEQSEENNVNTPCQEVLLEEKEDSSEHFRSEALPDISLKPAESDVDDSSDADTDTDTDDEDENHGDDDGYSLDKSINKAEAAFNHGNSSIALMEKKEVENAKLRLQKYYGSNPNTIGKEKIPALTRDILLDEEFPLEVKLECIELLQKSSTGARKGLFDTGNTEASGVKGIFTLWLDKILADIVNGASLPESLNEEVISSILKLLLTFSFIKKASQVIKIKELFHVDLLSCVEKIQRVSIQIENENLIEMCDVANLFLNNVITRGGDEYQDVQDEGELNSQQSHESETADKQSQKSILGADLDCKPATEKNQQNAMKFEEAIENISRKRKTPPPIIKQNTQTKLQKRGHSSEYAPRKLTPLSPFSSQIKDIHMQSSLLDSNAIMMQNYMNKLDTNPTQHIYGRSLYPQTMYGNHQISNAPISSRQMYQQNLALNPFNNTNLLHGITTNHLQQLNSSMGLDSHYLNQIPLQSSLPTQSLFNINSKNPLSQIGNNFPYTKEYLANAQIHNVQNSQTDAECNNPYLVALRHNQSRKQSRQKVFLSGNEISGKRGPDEEEYVNVML